MDIFGSISSGFDSMVSFFDALVDPDTWKRVVEVIVGATLILLSLTQFNLPSWRV